jgi:two-component system cell cycle sensor histidine kinase/response regulator CckA
MTKKPSYEELEHRVQVLEKESAKRKRAEAELKRTLRFTESLLMAVPTPVFFKDAQGLYQGCNRAFTEVMGVTPEDLRAKTVQELWPSEHAEVYHQKDLELIRNPEHQIYEFEVKDKDGVIRPVIFGKDVFLNEDGEVAGIVGAFLDITEQKTAEAELREIFSMSLDMICIADINTATFTKINPAFTEILGFSEQELLGRPFLDFIHPEDIEPTKTVIEEKLRQGEKVINFKNRYRCKDGRYRWLNWVSHPVPDKGVTYAVAHDITEEKQIEDALQQSEERYRSLVENTLDGYFIWEIPSGRFIFLNQRICDLAGYTMQEGLSLTIWDVIEPDEHHFIKERIQAWMESKAPSFASNVYGAIRKDGSKFRAEVSSSLITYKAKPVIQGILRDVTEEEKLQMQLQQAQKMESIGTLAGGIAHDFNNLLMGIQGRTSLMMADLDSSHPHAEHLRGIEVYVKSATDLTEQLLGFAMGGKYEVKPTDLNDLIKNSSKLFGRTKKEISIYIKLQKDLWTVEVDQNQIDQVLLNLYVNAWQAMPSGGELYLQTQNTTLEEDYAKAHFVQPGRYVKISIADTGLGMDETTQQKIFDPFFTTKEMGRGTGLGLASAYGIIKNHDGIINVYSEKGKGTTFNIYLPVSEKEMIKEKKSVIEILKGSETVLLVDDEQMIIDVGEPMLEKLGYKVMSANSGRAAIDLYQEKIKEIDIVILDMIMPDMNGGETYDQLKKINPNIKVLLSSGYSINGKAQEILDRGCDGFIQKPFHLNELSQRLREILDNNVERGPL